jgi:RHH-type proline utilization regulon transcriptional repressor/proline dehydrogenase/delta 1-pyrroline-5-carboxylate dehydrogenase
VLGERNVLRYRACTPMLLRAAPGADVADALLCAAAALTCGVEFVLSVDPSMAATLPALEGLHGSISVVESADAAAARLSGTIARVRVAGPVEPQLRAAAEAALVHVVSGPALLSGRFELLHYHREQSVSHRYHRYGNLAGERLLAPLRTASDRELASTSASRGACVRVPARPRAVRSGR